MSWQQIKNSCARLFGRLAHTAATVDLFLLNPYSHTLFLICQFNMHAGKLLEMINVTTRHQKTIFSATKSGVLHRLAAKLMRTQQHRTISVQTSAEKLHDCRVESMEGLVGLHGWSVRVKKLLQKSLNLAIFGSICHADENGLAQIAMAYFKFMAACVSKGGVSGVQCCRRVIHSKKKTAMKWLAVTATSHL